MPCVSVVIPLYQTERFIAAAIASVLAQTYADFEVLVVDDGSRDRGPDIAKAFGDPRIRVVTQENRGLAGARNTGIRLSTGTYVALLDADDLWHPHKLSVLVGMLERDQRAGIAFSASRLIDDEGQAIGLVQRPSRSTFGADDVFCRNPIGNGSAPVIRRAALDDIAFLDPERGRVCWFDESFRQSEDIECWTRLVCCTRWQFAYADETLTDYRVTSGGLSANTERQLETWRRFRAKVALYAPELEARSGNLAEAYQLRYLARRAIRGRSAWQALHMTATALALEPRLLIEEPGRTLTTLAAAVLQSALPRSMFDRVEAWAIERTSRVAGVGT